MQEKNTPAPAPDRDAFSAEMDTLYEEFADLYARYREARKARDRERADLLHYLCRQNIDTWRALMDSDPVEAAERP